MISVRVETEKACCECKTIIDFNSSDPVKGHIWYCENDNFCENYFCSSCYEEIVGGSIQEDDKLLCPVCFNNKK